MSTYQFFLGDETLIPILRVLPFNADLKEKILDIIIDDLVLHFFIYGSPFSELSLGDNDWELDLSGYFSE